MFMLTNEWISRQNKIILLVSFLDWKYIRLHCSVKKRTRSNWQWNVLVCLSEYTVTDHGSILAENKFYASTNLVKFIFKSFVSCNLHSGLLHSKQHGLQIFIQGSFSRNPFEFLHIRESLVSRSSRLKTRYLRLDPWSFRASRLEDRVLRFEFRVSTYFWAVLYVVLLYFYILVVHFWEGNPFLLFTTSIIRII